MSDIAVVNLKSYKRRHIPCLKRIISLLEKDLSIKVFFTQYAQHAEKIVKDSPDAGIIVAMGGDGTIFEVVNNMDFKNQALALMPIGTGNSIARDLNITSCEKAINAIKSHNKFLEIDIILCEFKTLGNKWFKKYVVATSGVGFIAETVIFAAKYFKSTGPLCYPISTLFTSFKQKIISADVYFDDLSNEKIEFTTFIVNNSRYAANFCVFPEGSVLDSVFNVLHAKTYFLTQLLNNFSIITGTYFYLSGIRKKAASTRLILARPCSLMLDGEIFDSIIEVKYTIQPRRLRLLV